jgi:4-hydroxy-3-methylbut-2-enyl diphosphate reductase
MEEAQNLSRYILGQASPEIFQVEFEGKFSAEFEPTRDLAKVGVVNQTTMLATETQAIADFFRKVMIDKYGETNLTSHFADTRDTLCYATNDNQDSTYRLLEANADLAVIVGGYNSSNTTHIVELCERKFPTYFIRSEKEILTDSEIRHFDIHQRTQKTSLDFLPKSRPVRIILTSGASCPDTLVDRVLMRLLEFFEGAKSPESILAQF